MEIFFYLLTTQEVNNDYFLVERSVDGELWKVLDKVQGMGTYMEPVNYELTDEAPSLGVNYYRLKQVDFDGKFEYSSIKTTNFKATSEQNVLVYPNPATTQVIVQGEDLSLENISIFNLQGQDILNKVILNRNSTNTIVIHIHELPKGLYLIKIGDTVSKLYKQ